MTESIEWRARREALGLPQDVYAVEELAEELAE